MNDINILDCSSIVEKIMPGYMLPVFNYMVCGKERKKCYYWVHVIYPKWAFFIDTIIHGVTRKHKTFISAQEVVWVDVENAFDMLISRWHILFKPCMFLGRNVCKNAMDISIIMHNMIVKARIDGYNSRSFREALRAVKNGNIMGIMGAKQSLIGHHRCLIWVAEIEWLTLSGRST